jgi:spore coat polysaccharide biosynthesis protein SpsF
MKNNSNKIVAIIQARMGSTRLPGKVLMEVNGKPLLETMLSRVAKSKLINKIIIATSTLPKDNQIDEFCINNGYECFRGSENDVLSRYYECSKKYNADVIVRLTADCPLIDSEIIDKAINYYLEKNVDYTANTVPPKKSTFPDGSDVEVFSMSALEKANTNVKDLKDREHVTFYFWKYNNVFKTGQIIQKEDWSKYRITVDYPEDFEVISFLFKEIKKRGIRGTTKEIVDILDENPNIFNKNAMYTYGMNW